VEEGVLSCECGRAFPILEGVPRLLQGALSVQREFLARWKNELADCGAATVQALEPPSAEFLRSIEPTMKSFQKEWAEHPLEEKTWGLDQTTRVNHSLRYLGFDRETIKGKLVLDAGAGTGQLTCSMARLGCEIVGVDLSPSVVRGWRLRDRFAGSAKTRVHIVQGNLMKPPFRKGIFDGIMSQGVLHHTPSTRQAFRAVANLVKEGGTLGVWLYKHGDGYLPLVPFSRSTRSSIKVSTLRRVTPKLPPPVLYASVFTYSAIFHGFYSVNSLLRNREHNQTIKERATSLFDSLAPAYVWRHTPEEVCGWFAEMSFEDMRDTSVPNDVCGFCITGARRV
jgi:SAM-dependent methyltransferase